MWNENPIPVEVSPFTEATGPTSGVAEDGTAIDFFYLMFLEELIEQIFTETAMHGNVSLRSLTVNGMTQCLMK